MPDHLKLPIRFSQFFEQKKLDSCSLKESIARNLHLLITTQLEENKQDFTYGSQFWDHDYDIHLSNDSRREIIISSLKRQLQVYEKRLSNASITVNVKQKEYHLSNSVQLRRRIEVIITGNLLRSDEPFRFETGFFIGPMLFD